MIKVLFEIYKVLGRIGIKPKDVIGMGGDIVKMGKSLFNTRVNPKLLEFIAKNDKIPAKILENIKLHARTLKNTTENQQKLFLENIKSIYKAKTPKIPKAVDASGLKLAKPPKESSRSFLEMMADRGHKVLKPGTPEYEAYIKKGLRTFPGGRVSEKRGVGSLFKETKDKAIKFYDDIVEESTALAKRTGKDVRGLIEERIGYKFTGKESMDDIITIIKEKFFKDGGLATLFEGRTDGD